MEGHSPTPCRQAETVSPLAHINDNLSKVKKSSYPGFFPTDYPILNPESPFGAPQNPSKN
jgi:hypothetical protein